jgi:hypothetical protein
MGSQPDIIVAYDDDEIGYIIYEKDNVVYSSFWRNYKDDRKIVYVSKSHLYDVAQTYLKSMLKDYTPLHTVQTKMFEAYIFWYEKNILK